MNIDAITTEDCRRFLENPTTNPLTKRKISTGGPVYRLLSEKCKQLQISNPPAPSADIVEDKIIDPSTIVDAIKSAWDTTGLVPIDQQTFRSRFLLTDIVSGGKKNKTTISHRLDKVLGHKVIAKSFLTKHRGLMFEAFMYRYIQTMSSYMPFITDFFVIPQDIYLVNGAKTVHIVSKLEENLQPLTEFFAKPPPDLHDFLSVNLAELIFDMLYIVYVSNHILKIKSNDAHSQNLLFRRLSTPKAVKYYIDGKWYTVKRNFELKVYDWDLGSQYISDRLHKNSYLDIDSPESLCEMFGTCNQYNQKDVWMVAANILHIRGWILRVIKNPQFAEGYNMIMNAIVDMIVDDVDLVNRLKTAVYKQYKPEENVFWSEFCPRIHLKSETKACNTTNYPNLNIDKVLKRFLSKITLDDIGMQPL